VGERPDHGLNLRDPTDIQIRHGEIPSEERLESESEREGKSDYHQLIPVGRENTH